ncbi:MAG: YlxM family DNA-binding protein [Clostridiales bacterium]|nr:YlxM family DNA-binding protein [Clostridiales bacterium]
MNDRIFMNLIYDFYGELLTEKQKNVFESHFAEDLSFVEIGEVLGISKQAAWDILNRTKKQLLKYEEKLGLAERFLNNKKELEKAKNLLEEGPADKAEKILEELIEHF